MRQGEIGHKLMDAMLAIACFAALWFVRKAWLIFLPGAIGLILMLGFIFYFRDHD